MVSTRFLRQAAFCSLMTLLVTSVLQAQPPSGAGQPPQEGGRQRGGGRGGFGGGFGGFGGRMGGFRIDRARLLGNDKVRAELKIEEAQAATIDAALEAFREERSSSTPFDREAFQNLSEEERTAMMEKLRKEGEELSKKTDEVLNALLEPDQTKRLDQISFQFRMNTALQTLKADDIKEKLSITEEQVAALTKAEETLAEEARKAREERQAKGDGGGAGGPGFDPAAFQAMMKESQEKSTTAAMALLTDDQKKSIEEMSGAKFELDMSAMFGGGRGGPGGGRGGPGGGRPGGGGRGTRPPAE